ncbi:ABC transporter substrate-binding protein [Tepidiforma thermophila]|uniref:Peptide/nickel transport system substrate-binding protein n=1 Tax=Tepidiforma thermophila (strain KCTC 52669 / CGMCC 1.13589 / G233) TaxID=2761530 RepID=A0A2A9HI33_TEPT2|nr:ABC transporter substrate-binding protein [Tepidiforma thermophila]PFG75033.1 peptide/nickel transport system substrate-binding protein [Tepidiforma thermophila]
MPISRRTFVKGIAATSFLALPALGAACGDDDEESSAGPTPGTAGTAPAATPTAARRGPSTGTMRFAEPFLAASLDADSGASAAYNLQAVGAAECLMRFSPTLALEPWIAARFDRLDDLTWKITLRDDVTFWDGSPVDAAAVRDSLLRTIEKQPATADRLPKETQFTASGYELTIKTPKPLGLLPAFLADATFAIKKALPGDQFLYTGPFKITGFTAREAMTLEAYEGYRGGPPWIKTLQFRQVADTNARSLALQSGDVELAQALLPSDVERLKSAGLTVHVAPWARQHMIILNVRAAPFDDVAVRRAFALAIDREAMVKGIMEGAATPAYAFAPDTIGHKGLLNIQKFDPAEARRVLDAAGWKPAADGIRAKDGKRLSFKLNTYAGRAELEQAAVVAVDMLKAVGMEASIEKVADIEKTIGDNAFQAAMYSIGPAGFGELSRAIGLLYVPSSRNKDRYSNPVVNSAYDDYISTSDEGRRQQALKTIQEQLRDDVPIVYLFNPKQVVGTAKKVKNFTPHPLDSYRVTPDIRLEG